jgi:hypothetical protein
LIVDPNLELVGNDFVLRIENRLQALGKAVACTEPVQLGEIDCARLQLDTDHQVVATFGDTTDVRVALVEHGIAAHDAQTF